MQSRSLWSPDDQQCPFNMSAFPESGRQITKNQGELGSANGRGCVKTHVILMPMGQRTTLEVQVFKLVF